MTALISLKQRVCQKPRAAALMSYCLSCLTRDILKNCEGTFIRKLFETGFRGGTQHVASFLTKPVGVIEISLRKIECSAFFFFLTVDALDYGII